MKKVKVLFLIGLFFFSFAGCKDECITCEVDTELWRNDNNVVDTIRTQTVEPFCNGIPKDTSFTTFEGFVVIENFLKYNCQ